jgi:hypothetical protein
MNVIQTRAVGRGEAKQLMGAARMRDPPTEHTRQLNSALGRWRCTPEGVRGWRAHTPCRCCAGRGVGKLALLIEPAAGVVELTLFQGPVAASAGLRVRMRALLSEAGGLGESNVALPRMQGFVAATRGRVIQPLRLAVLTRGLVIPPLRLAVVARGLVIPLLWLAVLTRGLSIPSLRLAVVAGGLIILSLRLVTVTPLPGFGMPSR